VWLRRTVRRLSSRSSLRQHCGKQPLHANHSSNIDYGSPETDRQAAQTSRRVLESAPCSPWGGSMSHPRPPSLQLLSLNVQWPPREAEAGGIVCGLASWGMSLLCKRHTMLPRQRLPNGVERGHALPPHGMAHHFGLLAHQPAAAWPCCSRLVPFCRRSQLMPQTPVADLLLLKAP